MRFGTALIDLLIYETHVVWYATDEHEEYAEVHCGRN